MAKTAAGLAEYCRAQLGGPYWWGCFGQRAGAGLLMQKRKQYPEQYGIWDYEKDYGKKVHDCCGLIKGYLWCDSPDSVPHYNPRQDLGVSGLYAHCKIHGDMSSLPEEPGVLVFKKSLGHVGVYMGGGKVIEAMGKRWGVVENDLRQRDFSVWGKLDFLSYSGQEKPRTAPSYYYNLRIGLLKPGMEDFQVLSLQQLLRARGYSCPESSRMDEKTVEALKSFQRDKGLLQDGEAGGQSWTKLLRG